MTSMNRLSLLALATLAIAGPFAAHAQSASAPAASQTFATALMKEILVARKAFAATFTSSAVARSVVM